MFQFYGLPFVPYQSSHGGYRYSNAVLFQYVQAYDRAQRLEPVNDNRPKSAIEV